VKDSHGDRLRVRWHCFPLEQVNHVNGPEWKLWEQPDDFRSRGLWALRAGEAAKLQGELPFERFHMALLRARHEQRRDIADRAVLAEVARETGLDVDRFQRDLVAAARARCRTVAQKREVLEQIDALFADAEAHSGEDWTPAVLFNLKLHRASDTLRRYVDQHREPVT